MIECHTQTEMLYIAHVDFRNGLEGACTLFPVFVAVFTAFDLGLKGSRNNGPDTVILSSDQAGCVMPSCSTRQSLKRGNMLS